MGEFIIHVNYIHDDHELSITMTYKMLLICGQIEFQKEFLFTHFCKYST